MSSKKEMAIVFVCHSDDSIAHVIHYNQYILLVGDQEIKESYRNYPKLIVARDLKNNIEKEKTLLTFTAWYAIVKNELFKEYAYLCILEYDVVLNDSFEETICNMIKPQYTIPNFSFLRDENCYMYDVKKEVMEQFLEYKNADPRIISQIRDWGCTTNQCIRRDVLNEFVEWYEPSYLFIKERDEKQLPYYHERLYMAFLKSRNRETFYLLNLLQHLRFNSHRLYTT